MHNKQNTVPARLPFNQTVLLLDNLFLLFFDFFNYLENYWVSLSSFELLRSVIYKRHCRNQRPGYRAIERYKLWPCLLCCGLWFELFFIESIIWVFETLFLEQWNLSGQTGVVAFCWGFVWFQKRDWLTNGDNKPGEEEGREGESETGNATWEIRVG